MGKVPPSEHCRLFIRNHQHLSPPLFSILLQRAQKVASSVTSKRSGPSFLQGCSATSGLCSVLEREIFIRVSHCPNSLLQRRQRLQQRRPQVQHRLHVAQPCHPVRNASHDVELVELEGVEEAVGTSDRSHRDEHGQSPRRELTKARRRMSAFQSSRVLSIRWEGPTTSHMHARKCVSSAARRGEALRCTDLTGPRVACASDPIRRIA